MALMYHRPWLHVDLTRANTFVSAEGILQWIEANAIEILHVTGPKGSEDPRIYDATAKLLKVFFLLAEIKESVPPAERVDPDLPKTVEEAVERLIFELSHEDKIRIASLSEPDLGFIEQRLGYYVRERYGLVSGNPNLLESCRGGSERDVNAEEASSLILRKVWQRLLVTYRPPLEYRKSLEDVRKVGETKSGSVLVEMPPEEWKFFIGVVHFLFADPRTFLREYQREHNFTEEEFNTLAAHIRHILSMIGDMALRTERTTPEK